MRPFLLTLNGLLFIFMLLMVSNWYAANSHLPLLEWRMFLPSPVPFLFLVISLPFMPYRGTKQLWLVAQAFAVGLPLAFSWLAHGSESLSNAAGAGSFVVALALLTFNLRVLLGATRTTAKSLLPIVPGAAALLVALLVARNEAQRPIDGKALDQLFQTYQQQTKQGSESESESVAATIKTTVVEGMVAKGYSRGYSEAIARDTKIEYLVPLASDWKLVGGSANAI
jgi:hypothetical protein